MSNKPPIETLLSDLERATTADAVQRVAISKIYREAFVSAPFWEMAMPNYFTGPMWATNVLDALQDRDLQERIIAVARGRE